MARITNAERLNRRVKPLKVEKELVIDSATQCCDDGTCDCKKNVASEE